MEGMKKIVWAAAVVCGSQNEALQPHISGGEEFHSTLGGCWTPPLTLGMLKSLHARMNFPWK